MNIDLLVTWFDVIKIFGFGIVILLVYRRGVKDGKLAEQERILMDWVKKQLEQSGHE